MHDVQLALTLAVTSGAGFLMVASGVHKRLLERPQARLCASQFAERTHTKQLRRKKPHAEVDLDAMEPLWSTVVATGGNRSQLGSEQARRNKPKPLPWLATSCRDERMVRRGSTVRVRQRALFRRRSRCK